MGLYKKPNEVIYVIKKRTESLNFIDRNIFGDYIFKVIRGYTNLGNYALSPVQYRNFKKGKTINLTVSNAGVRATQIQRLGCKSIKSCKR